LAGGSGCQAALEVVDAIFNIKILKIYPNFKLAMCTELLQKKKVYRKPFWMKNGYHLSI